VCLEWNLASARMDSWPKLTVNEVNESTMVDYSTVNGICKQVIKFRGHESISTSTVWKYLLLAGRWVYNRPRLESLLPDLQTSASRFHSRGARVVLGARMCGVGSLLLVWSGVCGEGQSRSFIWPNFRFCLESWIRVWGET
jgi:hypothetical protein